MFYRVYTPQESLVASPFPISSIVSPDVGQENQPEHPDRNIADAMVTINPYRVICDFLL